MAYFQSENNQVKEVVNDNEPFILLCASYCLEKQHQQCVVWAPLCQKKARATVKVIQNG